MGKKALAVVPVLSKESKLERFHGDAAHKPLYTVVTWSSQKSAPQAAVRKRQLAIAGNKLLEMQRFEAPENERSWFIGNDVQQDGSMLVFTPIDPLFVLLASTWRHRERSMSLYDLLSQDHNSWLTQVAACTPEKFQAVCDVQPIGGDDSLESLFVKASEAKTLKWLAAKVNRVAKTLAKQASEAKAQSNSTNFDANFVLPGQSTELKPEAAISVSVVPLDPSTFNREAIELLADYLPDELTELLFKEFKLEKLAPVAKQLATPTNPHETFQRFDRRQVEISTVTNNKRTRSPAAAATAAKKKSKLASVDRTGMKSLTSFFTKK